jgi:hypothetical protein
MDGERNTIDELGIQDGSSEPWNIPLEYFKDNKQLC